MDIKFEKIITDILAWSIEDTISLFFVVGFVEQNYRYEDPELIKNTSFAIIKNLLEEGLVIAGDLFDTKIPSPTETAIATAFLKRLLDTGVDVIIAIGNHDLPAQRGAHNTLSPVENLQIDRLHILPEIGIYKIKDIDILSVPYTYFDKDEARAKIKQLHDEYTGDNLFSVMHAWVDGYLPVESTREFTVTKSLVIHTQIRYYHY